MLTKEKVHGNIYVKILNFISYKRRSEKEIEDKLRQYSEKFETFEDLDSVLSDIRDSLVQDGYYNDSLFAELYVEGCISSSNSYSPTKMKDFMYKKGIPNEIIDIALNSLKSEQVFDMALEDGKRKFRSLPDLSRKSLYSLKTYLFRKGYSSEIIDSVVDTLTNLK